MLEVAELGMCVGSLNSCFFCVYMFIFYSFFKTLSTTDRWHWVLYIALVYNVSMLEVIGARCGIGHVMFMTLMCYTELQFQH